MSHDNCQVNEHLVDMCVASPRVFWFRSVGPASMLLGPAR
uniref:Uncharacterized protein n=1 Tax=Setaria italica TaxID=4555 RepID=K3Z1R0_SETIT